MNATKNFLKTLLVLMAMMACGAAQSTNPPQWLGNFSLSISHGLNYHLDGSTTIYKDEFHNRYHLNNATSCEVAYRLGQGFSISCFAERFSGRYDHNDISYSDPGVMSRSFNFLGISTAFQQRISKNLAWNISLGSVKRDGYELYGLYRQRRSGTRTIWLSDLGIASGLGLNYSIGKGVSVFALVHYARFVHGRHIWKYPDGPTRNYIRTRIGIQYSFSHLVREKE